MLAPVVFSVVFMFTVHIDLIRSLLLSPRNRQGREGGVIHTQVARRKVGIWPPAGSIGQSSDHLMRRADSLEKIWMLKKIEDRRRRQKQRMRQLNSITDSVDTNLSKFWEVVKDREAWHAVVHEIAKSRTRLSDWTATTGIYYYPLCHTGMPPFAQLHVTARVREERKMRGSGPSEMTRLGCL